jgi:hypothetical protein
VSLSQPLEESVDIAWVYLERSGELGDGDTARFLTDTIDQMIYRGQKSAAETRSPTRLTRGA